MLKSYVPVKAVYLFYFFKFSLSPICQHSNNDIVKVYTELEQLCIPMPFHSPPPPISPPINPWLIPSFTSYCFHFMVHQVDKIVLVNYLCKKSCKCSLFCRHQISSQIYFTGSLLLFLISFTFQKQNIFF